MIPEILKKNKDIVVAIDFETSDSRGASYQFFRKDFKIFSVAISWRSPTTNLIESYFTLSPGGIRSLLKFLSESQHKVIAHNLPYEMGCTTACYGYNLNWYADTMRLSQLRDGGGNEFDMSVELTLEQEMQLELGEIEDVSQFAKKSKGLSLEACAMRFLESDMHSHKSTAHDYLKETHGIKKNYGRYLHLLPYAQLKQYNTADTDVTLLLYEEHVQYFNLIKFNWFRDNKFYLVRAKYMTEAYIRGLCIDQQALLDYICEIEQEIEDINQQFMTKFAEEIKLVESSRFTASMERSLKLKTKKGKYNRILKLFQGKYVEEYTFNINSSSYLKILFCDVLKMSPKFLTPKGSPSFKAAHLNQWGEGGKILAIRKKRLLVLQQTVNTLIDSFHDGNTHPGIKISGTRTNRVAGGRI